VAIFKNLAVVFLDMADTRSENLLEETPPDALRVFLAQQFTADPDLKRWFHSFLNTSDLEVYELRSEIESKYGYQSAPNFTTYEERAASYIETGRYRDAATIYRAMFEAMRDHLYEFDPHRGGFEHDQTFQHAIASYATCIRDANLPHEDKREYIEYCFGQWLDEHEEGGFPQYFKEGLWEICTTEADYRYWQSLLRDRLDERLDSDRLYGEQSDDDTDMWRRGDLTTPADEDELLDGYTETAWLRGYVKLLDRLDEQAELGAILNRHYPASRHLCLRYARLLAHESEQEAAISDAEYGIDAFSGSDTVPLCEFLVDQYEGTDPDAFWETMIELFAERTDWTYYDRLKAATPDGEWEQVADTIVDRLDGRWETETIAEIYLREERVEDAFETVTNARDLDLFDAHIEKLREHDPAAYFDAYRREIKKAAADASRRKYYRLVTEHLQTIQTLGRDRRFSNLLTFLREEYSNRPAFLDELEKAGV
jgi:hypothetical protein